MSALGKTHHLVDSATPPVIRSGGPRRGVGLPPVAWFVLLALVLVLAGCRLVPLNYGVRETPTPVPTLQWPTSTIPPTATLVPTITSRAETATRAPSPSTTQTESGPPSLTPPPTEASPAPTKAARPVLLGTITVSNLPAPGHSPAGTALLGHDLYVANRGSDNVSIIVDGVVRHVVPVAAQPCAIVADPEAGRVFVLSEGASVITVLEGTAVTAIWPLPDRAEALALVGNDLWVGTAHGRVLILSPQDGTIRAAIPLSAKGAVLAIAAAPEGKTAYAATYGRTLAIDAASRKEVASASLESYRTLGVSADGRWLYTNDRDPSEGQFLAVLEAGSLEVVRRMPIPQDPQAVVVDPRDGRVYLLSSTTDQLIVLDDESHDGLTRIRVGRRPSHLSLDAGTGLLYIANRDGGSVTVVDTAELAVVDTIPLATTLASMDVDSKDGRPFDPAQGRLYVAASSSDRILVLGESSVIDQWDAGRHPSKVRVIPGTGLVAVLSLVEDRLTLFDHAGQVTATYDTGSDPQGLMFDPLHQQLYAGDTVIDLHQQLTHTLRVTTIYSVEYPPVATVLDTRRNILYAVAYNGTPGSNGGNVVRRFVDGDFSLTALAPGRLSVIDLIYDEQTDRFYATNWRMGSYGLQISDAEDCREALYLRLDRPPAIMALNPATHHLWVALHPANPWEKTRNTLLAVYDTRTWGRAAEFVVVGLARSLAIDSSRGRVYVSSDETNTIHVFQDVAMDPPPAPTRTPSPTPWPSPTP